MAILPSPAAPPHMEYNLTPLGEQAAEKVAVLADWIELILPEVLAFRAEREGQLPRAG